MEHKTHLINYTELEMETKKMLLKNSLISPHDEVKLRPTHRVLISGEWFSHFIVSCTYSRQTFFLKVVKGNDNFLLCNQFLQQLSTENAEFLYPKIVVPEFLFQGMNYYITTYIEGQPLDTFPDTMSQSVIEHIADSLLKLIDQLSLIRAQEYSEQGAFVSGDYASILKRKLKLRLRHPLMASFQREKLGRALNWATDILDRSQFSQPTMIHMDVKPANIIYNTETGVVSLIDFEFARFGDIDYGWTQILLSGYNHFNQFYKKQIVPYIAKNRLSLNDAIGIPKYQCYLFYQAMCNLIYYNDRHLPCPNEMVEIFEYFFEKI